MELTSLTAVSPLDGRYADKTSLLRQYVSEFGLIYYRLLVEIRWLEQLAAEKGIPELSPFSKEESQFLQSILDNFDEKAAQRVKTIEQSTNHDVKAVEYYLRECLATHKTLSKAQSFIHFACTSEDINNLAYSLMVTETRNNVLLPELDTLLTILDNLAKTTVNQAMLSHTHGQAATPTTMGKEIANSIARLKRQQTHLVQQTLLGKCNGAVGNFNAHLVAYPTIDWPKLSQQFVSHLGLTYNTHTTQIEPHDSLIEILNPLSHINAIVIDLSRDMWLYISKGYYQQQLKQNEVGSSTMPHKVNPIDFENAEGNCGVANALIHFLRQQLPTSRLQRDLVDSTVLRNLGSCFGYTLIALQSLQKGLSKVTPNTECIRHDLEQHWDVLTEAVQTVMRKHGILDAYEQLKAFSRGKPIDKTMLHQFIKTLAIPDDAKQQLMQLTPEKYTGYAAQLAKD